MTSSDVCNVCTSSIASCATCKEKSNPVTCEKCASTKHLSGDSKICYAAKCTSGTLKTGCKTYQRKDCLTCDNGYFSEEACVQCPGCDPCKCGCLKCDSTKKCT